MEHLQQKFIRSAVHLPVKDLQKTIEYYRDTLGFTDEWTFGSNDGGIRRDELRLLFAQDPDFTIRINDGDSRLPILWFVNNIDLVYEEFRQRRIPIESSLRTHPYGLREFSFVDINGYYIRVSEAE